MLEISKDFTGAWERFERIQTLRLLEQTHEWEWTRGRTDLFAFLIPIADDALCDYIAHIAEDIDGIPGVDPYPQRYWHATIKVVGFLADEANREDEVTLADVERMAEQARPALEGCPPFDLQLGQVNAFLEVVFVEVEDGGHIRAMNTCLLESVPGLQRTPVDAEAFLPHVSIARFASNEGLDQIKSSLRRLRALHRSGPGVRVESVSFIRAHLAREAPTFDLLAEYPLRG
ncbi:MAG TPA: 2'-5' RNA ligase family protein [Dehalococcoidia bacterium]|nr:2'-5' RNA ligase family protein [Dehalococcoidia bacterium]